MIFSGNVPNKIRIKAAQAPDQVNFEFSPYPPRIPHVGKPKDSPLLPNTKVKSPMSNGLSEDNCLS